MPLQPVVIVLAAGLGSRFQASGGAQHKLQSLLRGKPVLEHTLDAVRASGLPWHLVTAEAPSPSSGAPSLPSGMGDSIARGVRATRQASGWLVLPGDLPLVLPETLLAVAAALKWTQRDAENARPVSTEEVAPVVVPRFEGQRGHPVGFGAACLDDLLTLSGETGAASVVRKFGSRFLDVSDPGITMDIDTVADLARAEALLR